MLVQGEAQCCIYGVDLINGYFSKESLMEERFSFY